MAGEAKLELSAAEMRDLGYRVIDVLVDHFSGLDAKPVASPARREAVAARLAEPLPETGSDAAGVLDQVCRDVLEHMVHPAHPRFMGYIPCPGNFVGAMAETLSSGFNIFAGIAPGNHGPTELERVTVRWLSDIIGHPEGAGGLFTSGGSAANLIGLAVARQVRLGNQIDGAVAYCSDQTHSTVERAFHILGFAPDQLRTVPSDSELQLNPADLEKHIQADRAQGLTPFCVAASAGATNTGAVDPLDALADLCEAEDMWFHVDGAYGAAAALVPELSEQLKGLERVDSLSFDPHKWLFQPIECGCVLVRDAEWLPATFRIVPDYMKDSDLGGEALNYRDRGIQTTRSLKALKLWMSFKVFGAAHFRDAIRHGLALAEYAADLLRDRAPWRIVTAANLGILTFRHAPPGMAGADLDALNLAIVDRLTGDGFALLSTTLIEGRKTIRMCPTNPRATEADVRGTIERLELFAAEYMRGRR